MQHVSLVELTLRSFTPVVVTELGLWLRVDGG